MDGRGVYSHSLGYLGGTSIAIMLAAIAKRFPIPAASVLVFKFLSVGSQDLPEYTVFDTFAISVV